MAAAGTPLPLLAQLVCARWLDTHEELLDLTRGEVLMMPILIFHEVITNAYSRELRDLNNLAPLAVPGDMGTKPTVLSLASNRFQGHPWVRIPDVVAILVRGAAGRVIEARCKWLDAVSSGFGNMRMTGRKLRNCRRVRRLQDVTHSTISHDRLEHVLSRTS